MPGCHNLFLHRLDRQIRQGAVGRFGVMTETYEILVSAAVAFGHGVDHLRIAASAVKRANEVVVVFLRTFTRLAVSIENLLNLLENLW
ncbi:hypothetical protein A3E20_00535 [Candidatus Saccharibacteria bacterium RIFCSPHIGHO2_12_FULL_47_16]|nr:MAG: hypothetical protein A3E20_00535 [Candidatus Saccharibacteria bacterium RIFCSPHIGHO2_12_FULL_47_16]